MEATEIKNESVENTDATQQPTQPIEIPAELNQQQALQVLVDAAKVAQSKGIFTLKQIQENRQEKQDFKDHLKKLAGIRCNS